MTTISQKTYMMNSDCWNIVKEFLGVTSNFPEDLPTLCLKGTANDLKFAIRLNFVDFKSESKLSAKAIRSASLRAFYGFINSNPKTKSEQLFKLRDILDELQNPKPTCGCCGETPMNQRCKWVWLECPMRCESAAYRINFLNLSNDEYVKLNCRTIEDCKSFIFDYCEKIGLKKIKDKKKVFQLYIERKYEFNSISYNI